MRSLPKFAPQCTEAVSDCYTGKNRPPWWQTSEEGGTNAIKQVVAACTQAYAGLSKEKEELTEYQGKKQSVVEGLVGDNAKAIDQAISDHEATKSAKAKEKEGSKKNKTEAETAYNQAKDDQGSKQSAFDALKETAARLTQDLNNAKNLRKQIDTAAAQNQPATMYFVLKDLTATLASIKVVPPNEFKTGLTKVWRDLNDSRAALRSKKADWEARKAQEDAISRELDDLNKHRQEIITKRISQYNAPAKSGAVAPAQQAQAGSSPGTSTAASAM